MSFQVFERGGPAHDGPWASREDAEDHAAAARLHVASRWTSGQHAVLVVGQTDDVSGDDARLQAREFRVSVEAEEVLGAE